MLARQIGLFLGPIVFIILLSLPAPAVMSAEAWKVIALAAFMLVWWVTEAVPLAVAALLPMVGLPLLGVMDMRAAAAPYASPIVFLFMGGFMLALAMERWNLHRRIALNIVQLTGTNANGIILGFMLATAALSMWISNTATTVLMLPIALSVIRLLIKEEQVASDKKIRFFALSMMLGIAYAANIGGTATIIGTPPNVVFTGFMLETYDYEVSFAKWIVFGLPFALLLLLITFFLLTRFLYPNKLGDFAGAKALIGEEIKKLGRFSTGERRTLVVFLATASSWIFRTTINAWIPGLDISDPGIAILATIVLFVVPENFSKGQYLLDWEDTARLPWGILLLFGGGLSLANALAETGIILLIGEQFTGLENASFLVIIGLTAISLFLTEIMSNVALITVFLPVIGGIAVGADINPLYVAIPATLASSCAFMLPMSTPPNAIVFASGYLKVSEMVRAGIILNIITILLVAILANSVLKMLFPTLN